MGRKKDHFSIFSLSFSFFGNEWGQEMETREVFFFSSLSFLFVSFLSFCPFSFFFSLFFLVWERGTEGEMGVRVYLIFFPLFFFLREKNGRINWKNSKEILLLFLLNFLSFFFPLILLPFSFWEGEWRGKRINEFAFFALIHFCKNSYCLSKTKLLFPGQKRLTFSQIKTA